MKPLLYISGPYGAATLAERQINIAYARRRYVAAVSSGEWWAICPHTMTSGMEMQCPEIETCEWLKSDISLLSLCDALWVSMPDTCAYYSDGVALEIAWAMKAGMPVFAAFETPGKEHLPHPHQAYTPTGRMPQVFAMNPFFEMNQQRGLYEDTMEPTQIWIAGNAVTQYVEQGECIDPEKYKGSSLRRKQ